VLKEVFREPRPAAALAGQATLRQALLAGVAANLPASCQACSSAPPATQTPSSHAGDHATPGLLAHPVSSASPLLTLRRPDSC
jgi:hypothetical protein